MSETKSCPLGHECSRCHWQVRLRGYNPNTGQEIDNETCAMAALPLLLIENAQMSRSTGAAVESFRNDMVKGNQAHMELLARNLMASNLLEG